VAILLSGNTERLLWDFGFRKLQARVTYLQRDRKKLTKRASQLPASGHEWVDGGNRAEQSTSGAFPATAPASPRQRVARVGGWSNANSDRASRLPARRPSRCGGPSFREAFRKGLTSVMGKQVWVFGVVAGAVVLFGGAGTAKAASPYDAPAQQLIHYGYQLAEAFYYNHIGDTVAHAGWVDAYQADGYATIAITYDSRSQWYSASTYGMLAAQYMLTAYYKTGDPEALFAYIYLYNGAVDCLDAFLFFQ
jgi:hypothetical protein